MILMQQIHHLWSYGFATTKKESRLMTFAIGTKTSIGFPIKWTMETFAHGSGHLSSLATSQEQMSLWQLHSQI
jgi:hypothetical protein